MNKLVTLFIFVIFSSIATITQAQNKVERKTRTEIISLSHTEGKWTAVVPLKLGSLVLEKFELRATGEMVAQISLDGVPTQSEFEYSLNMGNLDLKIRDDLGPLTAGSTLSLGFRKRYDGGVELEELSARLVTQSDGSLKREVNSSLYEKSSDPETIKPNVKSSLVDEYDSIERDITKKNTYSGNSISANQALANAAKRVTIDTKNCPKNSKLRDSNDVRSYLRQQDAIQSQISLSIEKFSNRSIDKRQAIEKFNELIQTSNSLTEWGWGKVTNGTCGPIKITALIARSVETTKNLFKDYRQMIEKN